MVQEVKCCQNLAMCATRSQSRDIVQGNDTFGVASDLADGQL